MTEQEMNRLAYRVLVFKMVKRGMKIGGDFKRRVHQGAEDIGISKAEAMKFAETLLASVAQNLGFFTVVEIEAPFDDVRRDQIARKVLRRDIVGKPMKLSGDFRREVIEASKKLGVDVSDITFLFEQMIRDQIDEMFADSSDSSSDSSVELTSKD